LSNENMVQLQLAFVFLLNLFVLIYIGSSESFKERILNRIDLMDEIFIAFITLPKVAFTEFVDD